MVWSTKKEHVRWKGTDIGAHLKLGARPLAHAWATSAGGFACILGREGIKKFPTEAEARAWCEAELKVVAE